MNDRQLVLDTVEEICADTNNIDEVCMALEHSTIFATEIIQNLVEVIDKYKSTIDKIKEYCKAKIKETKELQDYSKWYVEGYDKAISLTHSSHSGVMIETMKSTTIKRYEDILELLEEVE